MAMLLIDFHINDRPDRHKVDADTEVDHIDIKLDRSQVRAAAAELKRDLGELHLSRAEDPGADEQLSDLAAPGEDLNMIDEVEPEPPGMGEGEDNAGER